MVLPPQAFCVLDLGSRIEGLDGYRIFAVSERGLLHGKRHDGVISVRGFPLWLVAFPLAVLSYPLWSLTPLDCWCAAEISATRNSESA